MSVFVDTASAILISEDREVSDMKTINFKMFIIVLAMVLVCVGGAFSIRSLARPRSPFASTDEQEITYRKNLKAVLKNCI